MTYSRVIDGTQSHLLPQGRVLSSNQSQHRLISTERLERNSRVIATNEYEPRLIEERYMGERIINVTTNLLDQRVISG